MGKGIKWTQEIVISTIQYWDFWKIPLYSTYVYLHYGRLYAMAIELFGSWPAALVAAGLNPKEIMKYHPRRSEADKIREIREIKQRGEPLNDSYIADHYASLHNAVRRQSSLGGFVEKAGFDYALESKRVSLKTRLRNLKPRKINRIRKKFQQVLAPVP